MKGNFLDWQLNVWSKTYDLYNLSLREIGLEIGLDDEIGLKTGLEIGLDNEIGLELGLEIGLGANINTSTVQL